LVDIVNKYIIAINSLPSLVVSKLLPRKAFFGYIKSILSSFRSNSERARVKYGEVGWNVLVEQWIMRNTTKLKIGEQAGKFDKDSLLKFI